LSCANCTASASSSSVIDGKRSDGSFAIVRKTICSSSGGTRRFGLISLGSFGRSVRCLSIVAVGCPPSNGTRPVNISHIMQPKAYWSSRWSTGSPWACSGAMYSAVPSTMPGAVRRALPWLPPVCVAMPKSTTLTTSVPDCLITKMFAGFKSVKHKLTSPSRNCILRGGKGLVFVDRGRKISVFLITFLRCRYSDNLDRWLKLIGGR
jgi:hypothetical protein